jgi:hypothetical protein
MALGYAPTIKDILAYYSRPEVASALCRAGQGRQCEFYHAPTAFSRFTEDHNTSFLSHTLREQILLHLQASMGGTSLQAVPHHYPGLHGSIERDLVLEVDDKTSQPAAYEGGKRIRDFLEERGLPYRLKYSGNCSMHFVIPREWYEPLLPMEKRETAFSRLVAWFQDQLRERVNDKLDESFRDLDHFLRLPYSVNEWTGLVSLPLLPEQYDGFKMDIARLENVQVEPVWFDETPPLQRADGLKRLLDEVLGDE